MRCIDFTFGEKSSDKGPVFGISRHPSLKRNKVGLLQSKLI